MAVVHVNRQFIVMNQKDGGNRPVYTIKETPNSAALYAHELIIEGPSHAVYSKQPLSCGAKAWIECDFKDIKPIGGFVSFKEAKENA